MEILNNFGFKPELFVAQVINFLVLAYLFKRFLYKPIIKIIKEREEKIRKGINDSENAAKLLANAGNDREEILKKAGKEAEKIIVDTKKSAETLREEILADAKKAAEKIIYDAKTQINADRSAMEQQLKSASLEISRSVLKKTLKEILTESDQEKITSSVMKRVSQIS